MMDDDDALASSLLRGLLVNGYHAVRPPVTNNHMLYRLFSAVYGTNVDDLVHQPITMDVIQRHTRHPNWLYTVGNPMEPQVLRWWLDGGTDRGDRLFAMCRIWYTQLVDEMDVVRCITPTSWVDALRQRGLDNRRPVSLHWISEPHFCGPFRSQPEDGNATTLVDGPCTLFMVPSVLVGWPDKHACRWCTVAPSSWTSNDHGHRLRKSTNYHRGAPSPYHRH